MDSQQTLDQLAEAIAERFGRQVHPEVQELILERLDAPGEHNLRCEWNDEDALLVSIDGIEVATL